MENIKQFLADRLTQLSDGVSVDEKENAMKELNISRSTLLKYLSGDSGKISKVETATELIQYFSEKVKARIEKIRETNLV